MSNDELTKHAIRTSADMLELSDNVNDIKRIQGEHSKRFDEIDKRFDEIDKQFKGVDERFKGVDERFKGVDERFDALSALLEDHIRKTDANFLEIRDLIGQLLLRSS
jgi:septation ring formation regulator EzrA